MNYEGHIELSLIEKSNKLHTIGVEASAEKLT